MADLNVLKRLLPSSVDSEAVGSLLIMLLIIHRVALLHSGSSIIMQFIRSNSPKLLLD